MVGRPPFLCSILLCVGLLAQISRAQQPTGTIAGTVTDATGARIPCARIAIAAPSTGYSVEITATGAGVYAVSGLTPGHYQVRIGADGFRLALVTTEVEVGRTSTIDVQLQIGAASESVTVSKEAVGVDSSQATLQGLVTGGQILRAGPGYPRPSHPAGIAEFFPKSITPCIV